MFRTRYIRSLIIAAAAVAAACTADPVDPADPAGYEPDCDAEPASLTINFSIADIGIDVSTRAQTPAGSVTRTDAGTSGTGSGTSGTGTPGTLCGDVFDKADLLDPDNPPAKPGEGDTAAEKYRYNEAALVNGSLITNLTVILVNNRTNRIVGVRRIPDPDCPNSPAGDVKNWILKEDGSLADDYLKDENGNIVTDAAGRPAGVVGTRACVTFDYEAPVHIVQEKDVKTDADKQYIGKSAEKLLRGEYTVLAVANYDHRVTTSSVTTSSNELVNTLNIDTTLEEIANEFHKPENMANGITFAPEEGKTGYRYFYNVRFLMNRLLKGSDKVKNEVKDENGNPVLDKDGKPVMPYIRPAVHQTLTAAKEFTLTAGDNHLDLELVRIASRTRVEVKNYSTTPLKVHSLEFSRNYTQSTCYLFRRNKNNRDYSELATNRTGEGTYEDHDGKGAPMVEYTGVYNYYGGKTYGAIVPFVKDWDSDGKDGADGVKVETNEKRCIFDALMYESHLDYKDENHNPADPDSFLYTIDVSYPKEEYYETTDLSKIDREKWVAKGRPMNYTSDKIGIEYITEVDNGVYTKLDFDHKNYYIHTPRTADSLYNTIKEIEATLNDNGTNPEKGEELYFFIRGVGSWYRATDNYLYEDKNDAGKLRAGMPDLTLDDSNIRSYLWKLDDLELKDGKYYCYLTNLDSGNHMPTIFQCVDPVADNRYMTTTNDKTSIQKYQLGVSNGGTQSKNDYYVTFSNQFDNPCPHNGTYNDSYLSIWANGANLSGYHDADRGCQYRLYPVKVTPVYVGTPRMTKTVELTAFSDATGYVEKVREIQRNDFIRILVEVSYNPDASDFMFKVNSWKEKTGTVDFH